MAAKAQTPRTSREDAQPGDEAAYWSQKQLIAMNERFCARMTRALAQERAGGDEAADEAEVAAAKVSPPSASSVPLRAGGEGADAMKSPG